MPSNDRNARDARSVPRNTAQLRDTIPSRRTPGSSSARDPAMASFDTDDEAAGRPAGPAEVELAHREHGAERGAPAKYPEASGTGPTATSAALIVGAIVVLIGLVTLLVIVG